MFLFVTICSNAFSFDKYLPFKFYLERFDSYATLGVVTNYLNIALVPWKVLIPVKYNLCYGFSATESHQSADLCFDCVNQVSDDWDVYVGSIKKDLFATSENGN